MGDCRERHVHGRHVVCMAIIHQEASDIEVLVFS